MTVLSPEILDDVLAAAADAAREAELSLQRGLGCDVRLAVSPESGPFDRRLFEKWFTGPGLALSVGVGEQSALMTIAESSGLLPPWYGRPNPTQRNRLNAMAQELGMLFLPEELVPTKFRAARIADLSASLLHARVDESAVWLLTELNHEGRRGGLAMIWPVPRIRAVFEAPPNPVPSPASTAQVPGDQRNRRPESTLGVDLEPAGGKQLLDRIRELPANRRGLFRIRVPLTVQLASTRKPLSQIMRLNVGSLIQFEKGHQEPLLLRIGDRTIARGEAVKVGDRFGLKLHDVEGEARG